ncbi:MAG: F0F1 ATP synthase subunit epsilon [Rhodospirillaceae bacterium]|nr:F0F1 ATP synthase subunit epsilon [Rhodospirillaceae bacterium]
MPDQVQFELVSPERLITSEPVDMLVAPGAEGDFGVLPGHAPFLTKLRPGLIAVFSGTTVTQRIFVSGGFAEVTPERCTVLAEEAQPLDRIDRAAVEQQLKLAREEAQIARDEAERAGAEARIVVAEAKLAVLDAPPY